jgi:hypothetical protein
MALTEQADAAAMLLQRLEEVNGDDWWVALLHAALDDGHDLGQAIATADAAFAEQPEADEDGEPLLLECGGEGGKPGPCKTKGEPVKKGKPAAGKAKKTPVAKHPIEDKSNEEAVTALLGLSGKSENGASRPLAYMQPDPWGLRSADTKMNDATKSSIVKAVTDQKAANAFKRLNLSELFDLAKQQQPDLSLHDFHAGVIHLFRNHQIRLEPFTQSLATHPKPQHLIPQDMEFKYYADVGECGGEGGKPGPCAEPGGEEPGKERKTKGEPKQ